MQNSEFEIEKEGVEDCYSICINCPSSTFVVFSILLLIQLALDSEGGSGDLLGRREAHLCGVELVPPGKDRRKYLIED